MQKIAVFTSGGDSPGMNAALRAVVRQSLEHGADCFAIQDGFSGMFKGEFRKMEWSDVAGILAKGGTICGTARCKEFRTIEGRRQAAMNLIHLGITGLVCIGGDGSLTGSDILTQEWSSHVEYLLKEKKITEAQAAQCPQLKLVGFTGTIDNDMFGTDATIGVWTALTRIVDAIDCLASTAESHRRCFVVECMGRRAGFLSLTAALVTGAEYTFIPESPPCCDRDDDMTWQTDLCNVLRSCRTKSRASVVVVCEGAIDKNGEKISAEAVRSCIEQEVGVEARLTVLGHVQRGGVPVPADRFIATQMGTRAVQLLLDDGYDGVPLCVGVEGTSVVALPLRDCVDQCQRAAKALDDREFHIAQSLRGSAFEECLRLYRAQHDFLSSDACQAAASTSGARVGILTVGATAPGMATAIAGVARLLLSRGARPLGFRRGFLGLVSATQPIEYDWFSLRDLIASGGSALTCVRHVVGVDVTPEAVAEAIKLQNLDALIVIGGFEAYTSVWRLQQSSTSIDGLKIPMVTIGATISSNLPGSECSIGCDRGVSNLVEAVDNVKQSAVGTRRVFVVEVMGRRCGYLSMIGAMCSGAERVLLPEAPPTLETVARDVQAVRARFEDARDNDKDRCAIWIKNECAGGNVITSTFLCNYFASEAHDLYDVRKSVLGHLQQGGVPTVIDRLVALRLSLATVDRIFDVLKTGDGHCFDHVGLIDGRIVCNSLKDFDKTVNMRERRPLEQWWRKHGLEQDFNVLAQPFAHYFSEANDNRTNNK